MTKTANTNNLTETQRARVEELIMKGWPKEDLTTAERIELEDLAFHLRNKAV